MKAKDVVFDFTISQERLASELSACMGAVEKKETIPILGNVLLEAREDQTLTLSATNLDMAIRCTCSAEVRTAGKGTVPARKLLDYVGLLPKGGLNLTYKDNHWVHIIVGRSRTRIAGMACDNFPELPGVPDTDPWKVGVQDLAAMIGRTSFSISTEESRFTLNAALLLVDRASQTMVATDGHRLAWVRVVSQVNESESGTLKLLLPKSALTSIAAWGSAMEGKAPALISQDDNHVFVKIGDRVLTHRKLTGNFPDYERVLPKDPDCREVILDREELLAGLNRVSQFADDRSHAVRFQFGGDDLKIFASQVEFGESEESIPCIGGEGREVEVCFNGVYVREFLRAVSPSRIVFRVKDEKGAGELRAEGDDGYRYVVMPMRG